MGDLEKIKAIIKFGSIEDTVYYIIKPIQELKITGFANESDAMALFSILLGQRAQAAIIAGKTKGNLMLDTGIDKIYLYYEECFGEKILFSLKLDLVLFVYTAMYLESLNFRKGIMEADMLLKEEVFDTIYKVCEQYNFYLVKFPRLLSSDNLSLFTTFMQEKKI